MEFDGSEACMAFTSLRKRKDLLQNTSVDHCWLVLLPLRDERE